MHDSQRQSLSMVSNVTTRARSTRQSYTQAQKAALRKRANADPKPSQKDLSQWFQQQYGQAISQSSLSCILSESSSQLDSADAHSSQRRRQRSSQFPELEDRLFAEQQNWEARGESVTSERLRDAGKRLWAELDTYRDRPLPAFSNGWLQGFKARYQMPVRNKRRKTLASSSTAANAAPASSPSTTTTPLAAEQEQLAETQHPRSTRHPPLPYQPRPAYTAKKGSPLYADRELYGRIAATAGTPSSRELVHSHLIPPRSGYAWSVPAGHILKIQTPSGPQVGDLNLWSLHNPRERFWAARTRQLHASHVRLHDRLWSSLPYLRPMATIIADSLAGYGVDEHGGRCHDLLGTRCDPYVRKMLTLGDECQAGQEFDFHCHSNLTRAILPWGLAESDVHDVLNLFQVTGLDDDGRYFMAPSPAVGARKPHDGVAHKRGARTGTASESAAASSSRSDEATSHSRKATEATGGPNNSHLRQSGTANLGMMEQQQADYIEFFAEIDLLCALSTCPGGDLSHWDWSDELAMQLTCRPLQIEVFKISDEARHYVLDRWEPPAPSNYRGGHGMTIPHGQSLA